MKKILKTVCKQILFGLLLLSFDFLLLISCKKDFSVQDRMNVQLTVESAEVTEAWLRLRVTPINTETIFTVKRDTHTVFRGKLQKADTLLYDSNLQPAHSYTYKTYHRQNPELVEGGASTGSATEETGSANAELTLTTMDTTSHDFTWQTFEFGGQTGSSVFYDVAIIDENDAWAVGEIYTENDKYNAAHWDGDKWELKKLDWDGYVSRLTCVYAFSHNDVWFGVTNLIHWNGSIFEKNLNPILNQFYDKTVNKIWGTSDNDLYIVGNNGLIAHYDGREWTRIESGTDLDISDIWGALDERTGKYEILCVGSKHLQDPNYRRVIYQIKDTGLTELSSHPIEWTLYSVWFIPGMKYYAAGGGIYEKHHLSDKEWENQPLSITPYYIYRIRGNQINDIVAAGGFGEIIHFNGMSWKSYIHEAGLTHGNYKSIAIKDNLIAVVGIEYPKAVIKFGRR